MEFNGSLSHQDQTLAWILGELQSHKRSNQNRVVNWDEVLELVDFELQKRITRARRYHDFDINWLRYLVVSSKRRNFRELKEEAEEYCRRRRRKSLPKFRIGSNTRWSGLSQVAHRYIFPQYRKQNGAPLERENTLSGIADICDDSRIDESQMLFGRNIKLIVTVNGFEEGRHLSFINNRALHSPKEHDVSVLVTDVNLNIPREFVILEEQPQQDLASLNIQERKSCNNLIVGEVKSIAELPKWDPSLVANIECHDLPKEFKELAFLLEQASYYNIQNHWNHVFQCMSPALQAFVDGKFNQVSFNQHGDKYRCLVGEKSNLRRKKVDNYRKRLRESYFGKLQKFDTARDVSSALISDSNEVQNTGGSFSETSLTPSSKTLPFSSPENTSDELLNDQNSQCHKLGSNLHFQDLAKPSSEAPQRCQANLVHENSSRDSTLLKQMKNRKSKNLRMSSIENPLLTNASIEAETGIVIEIGSETDNKEKLVKGLLYGNRINALNVCVPKKNSDSHNMNEVPTRVDITDRSLPDAESDLTSPEEESYPCGNQHSVACPQEEMENPIRKYVSAIKGYQLFSSSVRREAHLLLHLSQWKTWHLFNHTNGSNFAKTQETVFYSFRDDELYLSKRTFSHAMSHLIVDRPELICMAKVYATLRDKIWSWWCSLAYSCCVEFTLQNPRMWEDFEYTQRSLWEYELQLETSLRNLHFQQMNNISDDENEVTHLTPLSDQSTTSNAFPSGDVGGFVQNYVTCLKKYLSLSMGPRNRAFLNKYLADWKAIFVGNGQNSFDNNFLESQRALLEQFRTEESALVDLNFRGPYLRSFGTACSRPIVAREIELYFTIREKLWHFFLNQVLWESWYECSSTAERGDFNDFEKSQSTYWKYFQSMEHAILKVHGNRCSQLANARWVSIPPVAPMLMMPQMRFPDVHTVPGTML
jgi:hypothetical protein